MSPPSMPRSRLFIATGYKNQKALEVLVIRLDGDGSLVNSKPCSDCLRVMREMGVKKIWYSLDGTLVKSNPGKNRKRKEI